MMTEMIFKKRESIIDYRKLSGNIAAEVIEASKLLSNLLRGKNELTGTDLILLYISCNVLFYIEADRIIFDAFSDDERSIICDLLTSLLQKELESATKLELTSISEAWHTTLLALAPSANVVFAKNSSEVEGTLLWEFAKYVDEIEIPDQITHTTTILVGKVSVEFMENIVKILKEY